MATIALNYYCDLNQAVKVQYIDGNVFSGDNAGNTISIFVMDGDQPATIGGSVSADVIRADGSTVAVSGALDGNRAYVILPQACYAVPGSISIVIKNTQNTTVTTIAALVGNVYRSSTDEIVDPGTIIPSISSLIAAIDAAIGSIPADYSALLASIAADYSSSRTYPVGAYCWEAGVLKRCIVPITSAETYTAAHWTNAVIGDDLSALKSALIDLKIPFESGSFTSDGVTKTAMVSRIRNVYPISRDTIKSFTLPTGFSGYCYKLDASFTKLGTTSYLNSHDFASLEDNVQYLNIMIRKDDATTSNITEYVPTMISGTTVVTDTKYLMDSFASLNNASLIYRGNLSDLAYTSIAQCTLPGLYKFTGSYVESLTDLPSQWGAYGGYVKVFKVGTDYYQFVCTTDLEFERLGTTGTWKPRGNVDTTLTKSGYGADAKVTGDRLANIDKELLKCCVRFNSGSYRSGDAVARLQIFIQQPIGYLRYDMYHYKDADTTKNSFELWGIDNAYSVKSDRNTSRFTITNNGEWEMAVRLKNGSDFSGGITHGDEKNYSITAFLDGEQITLEGISSLTYFHELKIVQTSDVYSPSEDATEQNPQVLLARHGTEWIYTKNGLKINQYLKWVGAFEVTNTFLAMFPVRKTATVGGSSMAITDTMFTDVNFTEYDPSTSGSVAYPKATKVDIYSAVSGLHCTINVIEYPFGLPGGDQITESDNGGNNYYKIYVPITSSNDNTVAAYTTEADEVWKSSVEYILTINHGTGIAD